MAAVRKILLVFLLSTVFAAQTPLVFAATGVRDQRDDRPDVQREFSKAIAASHSLENVRHPGVKGANSPAQTRADSSSAFGLDSLASLPGVGLPSDPEQYTMSNDFVKHESHGWFPEPYVGWSYGLSACYNIQELDVAHNIFSASFSPTRVGFSAEAGQMSSDEAQLKKRFSVKGAADNFPSEGFSSDGVFLSLNLPALHLITRLQLQYDRSRTRLFGVDSTRSFLSDNAEPRSFKEVNVLFSNQHSVSAAATFIVPIYGAFLVSEAASFSSVYVLGLGGYYSHTLINENTQYSQIANAKDALRYANGTDTLTTLHNADLSSVVKNRAYAELSLGWRVAFKGGFMFMFEPYLDIPLHSVLIDASWYQYRWGFRISLGSERE